MSGAFQKGSKCYRCQYADRRGTVAAEVAGHPKSLQITESALLGLTLDVLSERVFGPDRLKLIESELTDHSSQPAEGSPAVDHEELRRRLEETDRRIRRQTLHLEEEDDPHSAVAEAAKHRIAELSAVRDQISSEIAAAEARRPLEIEQPSVDIAEVLSQIPDLRPVLDTYSEEELVELLAAFDVTLRVDKPAGLVEVGFVVSEALAKGLDVQRPPGGGRSSWGIAGAGFEPATFGL